jgi:alkanesulfonate monooxygenase SsuD/methylene tetrahydromethanopterin reductase-like flavin-dependent oxidoreductase (luciferase family)
MLRIGIELSLGAPTSGELLADVRAYEEAGAELVWLAPAGTERPGFEPLTLLAAAATVTSRTRLATVLPAAPPWPDALLGRVVATLAELGRGRIVLGLEATGGGPAAGEAARVLRAAGAGLLAWGLLPDDRLVALAARVGDGLVVGGGPDAAADAFQRVRELRDREPAGATLELWARTPAPRGRAEWRELLAAHGETGATGLLVAHAPNLLDILRNPEEDDRQDLAMATG